MYYDDGANAVFAFVWFSARIFVVPLWFWYVPLASPLYAQGVIWWSALWRFRGICAHVGAGMACLGLALVQFDAPTRRANIARHRWTGRAYVLCGLATLAALRPLRATVGQGPGTGPSRALQVFVDVSSLMWIVATAFGVAFAACGRVSAHRVAMTWSVAAVSVPVAQRFCAWMACTPLVLGLKLCREAVRGTSPWEARWNDETRVLSFGGYGVAEHEGFPASAWLGLGLVCVLALRAEKESVQDLQALRPARKLVELRGDYERAFAEVLASLRRTFEGRWARVTPALAVYWGLEGLFFFFFFAGLALGVVGFFVVALLSLVFLFEFSPAILAATPLYFLARSFS
ncbi:hypothetical protein CTAYLR_004323 [Chrysophaeum taylorii]|uniref:Uncharacterized protein n=1 Tax=Chrysophaeum taylorii TaxID=2483200 RepID=A0AAD7UH88_9STRA|nr:hypothetical protein CTAYLR_004323 [Chrysophaeum taylorii]